MAQARHIYGEVHHYDLPQKTRTGSSVIFPKVKRVYIAGHVKNWRTGHVTKRSGREVR